MTGARLTGLSSSNQMQAGAFCEVMLTWAAIISVIMLLSLVPVFQRVKPWDQTPS
jgi:hypothetical protein